jgi:hypothetical protein
MTVVSAAIAVRKIALRERFFLRVRCWEGSSSVEDILKGDSAAGEAF